MRPYWKGYLKLALVSCPIALHAACSSAERIALRQINKATGNRLRQQLTAQEGLCKPPQRPDCVAGVEGLELRNVDANYVFEKSHRFVGIRRILALETIRV
jgi:non-homologous end joining protein Ku